ncbi:MAG: MFS transporter [Alphaproteobacteria bacterium]|nr:MFS transporter [Alphaproteobacteria bacterium]
MTQARAPLPPLPYLICGTSLMGLGVTFVIPALTILRNDLAISADKAQLVLSVFLLTAALGQVIAGPVSDHYGRKPTILFGSALYFIGALVSLLATNIDILLLGRFLQGFGAACCIAMSRIMVNDCLEKNQATRTLSAVTAFMVIVQVLSLALSGVMADNFGWRVNIFLMTLLGFMMIVLSLTIGRETNLHRTPSLNITAITQAMRKLFKLPIFNLNFTVTSIQVGVFFAMNGFMIYHFQHLGASVTEFGVYFSLISVGYVIGNMLNRYFSQHHSIEFLAMIGTLGTLFAIMLMAVLPAIIPHPAMLSVALTIFGITNGMAVNNSMIIGISIAGRSSGMAIGLMGAGQVLTGSVVGSLVIALGGAHNPYIGLIVIALLTAISIICAVIAYMMHQKQPQ